METAMNHVRTLYLEACKPIVAKYDTPFLTEEEYQKEIGGFSKLAGAMHGINKQLKKTK